jgi:hypothetical protein
MNCPAAPLRRDPPEADKSPLRSDPSSVVPLERDEGRTSYGEFNPKLALTSQIQTPLFFPTLVHR